MKAATGAVARALASRYGVTAIAMLLVCGALLPTALGDYLEEFLFLRPALLLRARVGRQPHLDPRIRLVMAEDRSLERLGRQPTYAEWRAVARTLFAEGFERVLLAGVQTLRAEIGPPADAELGGKLALGLVAVAADNNTRASPFDRTLAPLFAGNAAPATFELTTRAVLPAPAALADASRLGHLNLAQRAAMPRALQTPAGDVIPNLGLLAAADLRWDAKDGLRSASGPVPANHDGLIYLDFVAPVAPEARLPVTAFLTPDGAYKPASPELKARLAGGKVALLIPDASTGSRFIDGPFGRVLSFNALVAVANSALTGRFLVEPVPGAPLVAAWLALCALVMMRRRGAVALGGGLVMTLLPAVAGFWALVAFDAVLPCACLVLPAAAALVARGAHHLLTELRHRLALSRDLELGAAVQRLLLPRVQRGAVGAWSFTFVYRPYGAMAGDWFQLFDGGEGAQHLPSILAIGDGVGKGPAAALNTALIAGVWNSEREAWRRGDFDADRLAVAIGGMIHATFGGSQNTTFSLAVLGADGVRLAACAAPYWLKVEGLGAAPSVTVLRSRPQNPLGMVLGQKFKLTLLEPKVDPGEVLIAYTDGVMEGHASMAAFKQRLATLRLAADDPALADALTAMLLEAGRGQVLPDDATILILQRRPAAGAAAQAA